MKDIVYNVINTIERYLCQQGSYSQQDSSCKCASVHLSSRSVPALCLPDIVYSLCVVIWMGFIFMPSACELYDTLNRAFTPPDNMQNTHESNNNAG